MNCTLAAGIFDTQVVSPAAAAGLPAAQVQPAGTDGASFLAILGAQDPTESVVVTPALASQPGQSAGTPQPTSLPLSGRSLLIGQSERPICLYPQTGGRLASDQTLEDGTVKIKAPSENEAPAQQNPVLSLPQGLVERAAPAETRASKAFRLEQPEPAAPILSAITGQPQPVASNTAAAGAQASPEQPVPFQVEPQKQQAVDPSARKASSRIPQPPPEPEPEAPGAAILLMQPAPTPAVAAPVAVQPEPSGSVLEVQPPSQPAQISSTRPVAGSAAASVAAANTESQTFEEISAPQTQQQSPAPQRSDAAQTARPGSQSSSSLLAQAALTAQAPPETTGSFDVAGPVEPEPAVPAAQAVTPAGAATQMHTALQGMLTVLPAEVMDPPPATSPREPGALLSLLKTAESDAINRRAFDTVRLESAPSQTTPRTGTGEAYSFAQASSETNTEQPAAQPQAASKSTPQPATVPDAPIQPDPAAIPAPTRMAASKSAEPAPAVRTPEERTEKAVPSKPTQPTIAAQEGPRVQTAESPVRQEALRPAAGVEMTQRIEALQTAQAAVRGSVHSITIPIGQESNPVATLRLVQQSSGVQITVQTPDAALSQSMQANLPQLLRGLEDSGFKADFQPQPANHIETTSAPVRTTSTDNRQSGSFAQGNAQQDGPAHGQDREKRQPSHEWREWLQHGRKQNKEGN
ncbi:hypothetical protein [Paludibaculum fermentans]|uniref:Uncharacterized protein n=1 Tax=Paludibaculum fermentans TaxID=1473598 RepID=A0A7S7NSD5_PALFE|nr:hypothetical protein [Paludibaculum fermentans]QOY88845.1 hypothetical protein IRI77_02475 [Paludibaculum fermentans]